MRSLSLQNPALLALLKVAKKAVLFAVGNASAIYYCARSSDGGASWTQVTTGASEAGSVVGNGKHFLIYNNGSSFSSLRRSSDGGQTWGSVALPATVAIRRIHCVGNTFLIVPVTNTGGTTTGYISPDAGITWTAVSFPAISHSWESSAYDGKAIVLYAIGGYIYRSFNLGKTWSSSSAGISNAAITIANGRLHVFVKSSTVAFHSDDYGATVTTKTNPASSALVAVGSSSVLGVSAGSVSSSTYFSKDSGATFSNRSMPVSLSVNDMWCEGESMAIVGYGMSSPWTSNQAVFSFDSGDSWSAGTLPIAGSWTGISGGIYDDELPSFMAVSDYTSNYTPLRVMVSKDGVNWSIGTFMQAMYWQAVIFANGKFIAASTTISFSTDGFSWSGAQGNPSNTRWYGLLYGGGKYIAVGQDAYVGVSTDGITWGQYSSPLTYSRSVCYGNSLFVAVGDLGIMYSSNGTSWTKTYPSDDSSAYLSGVDFGNSIFVAVGRLGSTRLLTSTDGMTWTARTPPVTASWQCVKFLNGLFVAVAPNYCMTSTDGVTWTSRTVPSGTWKSVAYAKSLFVAVSDEGYTMTSPDGVTWTLGTNITGLGSLKSICGRTS